MLKRGNLVELVLFKMISRSFTYTIHFFNGKMVEINQLNRSTVANLFQMLHVTDEGIEWLNDFFKGNSLVSIYLNDPNSLRSYISFLLTYS